MRREEFRDRFRDSCWRTWHIYCNNNYEMEVLQLLVKKKDSVYYSDTSIVHLLSIKVKQVYADIVVCIRTGKITSSTRNVSGALSPYLS